MNENDDKDTQDPEDREDKPSAEEKPAPKKKASREAVATRDRNQRVREQAARKLEEAKKGAEGKSVRPGGGLDAGEMFDDALARGFAGFTKWVKKNRRSIEIGVAVALLGGIGFATWDWYSTKRHGAASSDLFQALRNEQGVVKVETPEEPAAPKDEEEERFDTRPKFPTYDARREATVHAYRAASAGYGNMGAGMLARLGEAGALLDRRDYDGALSSANGVLASELAKADSDVRMSAKEIVGMALEGKGDLDGARKAFDEMASSDASHYKDLGEYHVARIVLAKGNKDEAKEKLTKLRERLSGSTQSEPAVGGEYVREQVDLLLRSIDPSLAPSKGANPASQLTSDQLKRLQEEIQRLGGGQPPPQPQPPRTDATPPSPVPPAPPPSGGH